ncbi:hypothetical protein [Nitrosomonas sp.]|uniref:hypothetical protein n=1 Tax=Nitrosomonas sp. TaxID=42353 RepID=UPI00262485D7|nr:hypothetical protein [Nitrosomonas sp.]MCW5597539.1 hypothetical protein [Nitrosomonas sp.]MCW5601167.1 hypothetical protein [Nitrosomonas sp.]
MQRILLAGFMLIVMVIWPLLVIASPYSTENDPCIGASMPSNTEDRDSRNQCASHLNASSILVLPTEALSKLKIDAGFGWGIFNGSIYNGNDDYAIERITVKLIPSQIPGTTTEEPLETKEYIIDVAVPPLSKGALSMFINSDGTQEFEWHLINAFGRKIAVNQ